jgi:hypothetical protein
MADEQPWLSLTEAARQTGLDREAIRSRVRRGLVPSRKNNRGELLVQLPAELVTELDRAPAEDVTGLRAAVADLSAEVTELRVELADAKATARVAEAAVATEVAARERYIAQLEALLAEARKPWWRRWR